MNLLRFINPRVLLTTSTDCLGQWFEAVETSRSIHTQVLFSSEQRESHTHSAKELMGKPESAALHSVQPVHAVIRNLGIPA